MEEAQAAAPPQPLGRTCGLASPVMGCQARHTKEDAARCSRSPCSAPWPRTCGLASPGMGWQTRYVKTCLSSGRCPPLTRAPRARLQDLRRKTRGRVSCLLFKGIIGLSLMRTRVLRFGAAQCCLMFSQGWRGIAAELSSQASQAGLDR